MNATQLRTAALAALVLAWTAPAHADGPPGGGPRATTAPAASGGADPPADRAVGTHDPASGAIGVPGGGATAAAPGRTPSPYFEVEGTGRAGTLPLTSTRVAVKIDGAVADVTVVQRYRNAGRHPLDARYVLPGSARTAVQGLSMRVGQRWLRGQTLERAQARAEYEEGRRTGQTTALVSKPRADVLEMNVANILPGDTVDVELHYTERVAPSDGRYQFVFPAVVGARDEAAAPPSRWSRLWHGLGFGRPAHVTAGDVELSVALGAPVAAAEAVSPSHTLSLVDGGRGRTLVRPAAGERLDGRDFVLDYRLAGTAGRT
jgi:Ca-activated chloride channel family protein